MRHRTFAFNGDLKEKLVRCFKKRPYLTIFIIWAIIYLPFVIGFAIYAPERIYEVHIDKSDIISSSINSTIYEKNNVTLSVIKEENKQIVLVSVPFGYVPEIVELEGYGKLYTNVDYISNRSWTIPPEALPFIEQEISTWNVKVSGRTDVMIYRDRGTTILEKKLLYRDVHTETPPLINLIWVAPALFGGSMAIFRFLFAIFALGAACIVLKTHQASGQNTGYYASLFLLLNPLTLYATLIEVEDELIIMFLFTVTLMFYYRKKLKNVAISIGLGMALKMWPVLITPGLLKERDRLSEKVQHLLIIIGIFGVFLVPFLFVAPDDIIVFIRLYLTGDSGVGLQGVSVWRFLGEVGFPTWVMLPVLFVSGIILFITAKQKHLDGILSGMLFVLLFLLLFPKIHGWYYLYLLPFLPFVWDVRNIKWTTLFIGIAVIVLSLIRERGIILDDDILLVCSLIITSIITALVGKIFIDVTNNSDKKCKKTT